MENPLQRVHINPFKLDDCETKILLKSVQHLQNLNFVKTLIVLFLKPKVNTQETFFFQYFALEGFKI